MRFLCAIRIVCWRVSVFYVAAVSAIPADGVPCGGRVLHGHLLALPLWFPAGGLPSLSPANPTFSLLFLPHPPCPPSPPGKGEIFLFSYARGFAPCIPGIRPPAALTETVKQVTGGGAFPRRCRLGGRWRYPAGACPLCRLPPLPLGFFLPPIPPPPFPSGEGGDFLFSYARGFAPCIPGIRPFAALTEPVKQVSGGVACRLCRLPSLPLVFFLPPIPPTPFPGGEGGAGG